MAELYPVPLPQLVSRMFRELEQEQAIFDLPQDKFFFGVPGKDLTARFQGHTAWTPLGPAAGPSGVKAVWPWKRAERSLPGRP